ncbi:ectomycorrhiza-induced ankyrin-domain/NACHT-domain-containing protein [Mycena latifolia]|nr:ectomycorrhiza-induced ankyrin-domain/NACHT-domain-containing protein [Mycena latifolia]
MILSNGLFFIKHSAAAEKKEILAEEKEILDWITSLNFFQRQADVFRAWQPGTGEWLLSDATFKNWKLGPRGVLWCQGIFLNFGESSWGWKDCPCAQFLNNDTAVACIYLNHKEREVQTPENLLASVWKQLILDRSLPPAAHDLYKYHLCHGPTLKMYIIVDALDEYPEDQRNILLEHLSMLQGPTTSLMMTSRPHVTLDDLFPDVLGLEIKATEDDIRQYVDKQIRKSPRLSKHVQIRPELHDEIKSTISSNTDGMFLLAKLHTESLAAKNTVKAVREALRHLPQNLNHTYEEAMNRIKNQNKEDRQLAIQALTWVAYAKRPLSVAELQEALAIEPDATTLDVDNLLDINIVLSVCAGLIIVDEAIMVHEWVKGHPLAAYSQHLLLHAAEANRQLDLQPGLTFFLGKLSGTVSTSQPVDYDTSIDSALSVAVFYGYIEMAQLLIKQYGANVNYQAGFYGTPLQAASHRGHESVAQFLIEMGAVNAEGGYYGTALQAASLRGHESIARFLIEKGADVNAVGGHYGNALQAASHWGHESVARFLIEKGADVNAQGGGYGTALQAASEGGHELIAQFLIEKGADVNAEGGFYGTTLQATSHGGHESIARFLTEKGADVNAEGGFYGTTLQAASHGGHESIARFLVEKGADLNPHEGHFGTALQAASYWGHESVVQFLIEKGADVNAQGGHFGTALQAASYWGHESVVQFLIEKGADVNGQGGKYGTALQAACACFWGQEPAEPVVQLLIETGADVNAQGGKYGTALQAASHWGYKIVARLLIENGAHLNQTAEDTTALWVAAAKGREAVVQLLIESGANLDIQGPYGTALEVAFTWGHESVVKLLIENGAHPVSPPERPRSAAGYIERQWREEIYDGGLTVNYTC